MWKEPSHSWFRHCNKIHDQKRECLIRNILLRGIKIFLIFIHMCNYLKRSLLFYSVLFKETSLALLFLTVGPSVLLAFFLERPATHSYFIPFSHIVFIQEFWSVFSSFSDLQVSDVNHSCVCICLQLNTHILTCTYAHMHIHTSLRVFLFKIISSLFCWFECSLYLTYFLWYFILGTLNGGGEFISAKFLGTYSCSAQLCLSLCP